MVVKNTGELRMNLPYMRVSLLDHYQPAALSVDSSSRGEEESVGTVGPMREAVVTPPSKQWKG
jgi:hypothetical protein